ncbi:hypothetical protein A3Q56_00778 [Intoshia linei]|uniref:Uncharacterized protein n=1 Tax=Intoshia linei TaxID=1819745 RepID=A0A177BAW5_9BILA|nr:hypothetical protein A3Q56_00778 [Intoshia linei]
MKDPCIVDDAELKIKKSNRKQCSNLDYICRINFKRSINNLCICNTNDSFHNTTICFNGKIHTIDINGYDPIFKRSYYEHLC